MNEEPTTKPINDDDNQPLTKGDLNSLESRMDAKFDAVDIKFDAVITLIKDQAEETRQHFDVVAENIHKDVAEANQDEITLIKDQQIPNLDTRTQALEKTTGLPVGSVRQ